MNRYCMNCPELIEGSGYCCKYKLKLAKEKKNGQPVRCIECVMDMGKETWKDGKPVDKHKLN